MIADILGAIAGVALVEIGEGVYNEIKKTKKFCSSVTTKQTSTESSDST